MYALVLGIHVAPHGDQMPATASAPRRIRLLVREKPHRYGSAPGYAFVLGGSADDSSGAMPVPGPTLVLERGQPVAITVVNQSQDHAAVHWHGIELEDSYADGVPGWSGSADNLMRAIPPGDSLTVHFTPPPAGTFMYHSHFNEFHQIPSGLFGALVVVDSTHHLTPDADRVWVFSDYGPTTNVIRGPFASVAKDGADLPASQVADGRATLYFDPGETYDFDFTAPASGTYALRFGDPPAPGPPGVTRDVVLRVH
ncbi:MAG TPA: multicopper oxidase domain-containing protein [Gemmatimonadaceae bacterium]|nr:multicopper oxidase domain-containing protein [Gemmatimonadaceae bacterium]